MNSSFSSYENYSERKISSPILLYEGIVEIKQGDFESQGEGKILLVWFPQARIEYEFETESRVDFTQENLSFKVNEIGVESEATVSSRVWSYKESDTGIPITKISGYFSKPIKIGLFNSSISFSTFLLPNFSHTYESISDDDFELFGKDWSTFLGSASCTISFSFDNWRVVLSSVGEELYAHEDLQSTLDKQGGFAITHIGILAKNDGSLYQYKESLEAFKVITYLLSFVRQAWVSPMLIRGRSSDGNVVLEEWKASRVGGWNESVSVELLMEISQGFYERWKSPVWNEAIELAIHWSIESWNRAGGEEGSIVLVQNALELIAWVYIVDDKKVLSAGGFTPINAADKIRLLLSLLSISTQIPAHFPALISFSKENNSPDIPQVLTEIRNGIVHANPKNRRKIFGKSFSLRREAWYLSCWYLELILLRLFSTDLEKPIY